MVTKKCSSCKELKDLNIFSKSSSTKDRLQTSCKPCKKMKQQVWQQNNRDKARQSCVDYKVNNKDKISKYNKAYSKNNRGIMNAKDARRRANKLLATPNWLTVFDLTYMKSIYKQGSFLDLHVDHIIPLQGKTVCGLHVPWNLQLLSPEDNLRKSNKF